MSGRPVAWSPDPEPSRATLLEGSRVSLSRPLLLLDLLLPQVVVHQLRDDLPKELVLRDDEHRAVALHDSQDVLPLRCLDGLGHEASRARLREEHQQAFLDLHDPQDETFGLPERLVLVEPGGEFGPESTWLPSRSGRG